MKRKEIYLFFILFFISANFFAQTIIKDKSYVVGTWKKSGSPYIIEGEAIVPIGKTLKIKPGVVVEFKTGDSREYSDGNSDIGFLRVLGTITAKGKANSLITFTRKGSMGNWGIVQVADKTNKSELTYCKIEYSHYIRGIVDGDNATGAISVYKCSPIISNCLIVNNFWVGINCKEGSNPKLTNNTIVGNKYGIECNTGSNPEVLNCILWKNETAFYINGDSSPKVSYSMIGENPAKYGLEDDGTNLINQNPLFSNELQGDYSLKSKSPCFKAGKGKVNIGAL